MRSGCDEVGDNHTFDVMRSQRLQGRGMGKLKCESTSEARLKQYGFLVWAGACWGPELLEATNSHEYRQICAAPAEKAAKFAGEPDSV